MRHGGRYVWMHHHFGVKTHIFCLQKLIYDMIGHQHNVILRELCLWRSHFDKGVGELALLAMMPMFSQYKICFFQKFIKIIIFTSPILKKWFFLRWGSKNYLKIYQKRWKSQNLLLINYELVTRFGDQLSWYWIALAFGFIRIKFMKLTNTKSLTSDFKFKLR